jgi:hypothetical protein
MAVTVDHWHSVPSHNQPPLVVYSVPRNPCRINPARSRVFAILHAGAS